jgi:hypothetical protein
VSSDTAAQLGERYPLAPMRAVTLKGVTSEVLVAALIWQ